jgi:prevent-host-death family protein
VKTTGVRDLQRKTGETVEASQLDGVVVTRNGTPAALLIGIGGQDWESVVRQANASFWALIQKRRKEKLIPLDEMRKRTKSPRKKR